MTYVVADVSRDPTALARVNVSDSFRAQVLALGCERVGFLGSLNRVVRFGFVVEVLRCKEPGVVAALYNIGSYGEGVAFWTLLDDGTIVTTERASRAWPLMLRLNRFFPLHRPDVRYFVNSHEGTPAKVLEKHLANVRAVSGSARPVEHDAFRLYAALRIRSGETMSHRSSAGVRLGPRLFRWLVIGSLTPWLAWVAWKKGIGAMLLVFAPSLVISLIASAFVARRLVWPIVRRRYDTPPIAPATLLARADEMHTCRFEELR